MKLIIQVVVGYMYKVQKNKFETSNFRNEFAAIRHGDYFEFLNLIGHEIDFIVSYRNGKINTNTKIESNDIDFEKLLKSGNSLKIFLNKCYNEFGKIIDKDISNEIYEQLALFELSLRMHVNNKRLTKERLRLEEIIDKIKIYEELTDDETKILHNGRKFLNFVKRPNSMKSTWQNEITNFNEAYNLIQRKKLTII